MKVSSFIIYLCTFIALISCDPDCLIDTVYNQFENACVPLNQIFSDDVNIEAICVGVFFSARPYPGNRSLYVGCMRGLPMVLRCYENETFDESKLECIFQIPETTTEYLTTSSTETSTEITTTTRTETTTLTKTSTDPVTTTRTEISTNPTTTTWTNSPTETTTTKPKNPCEGITMGYIPHPSDCTMCQMCILQQIVEVECKCESGQIFWISECVNGDPETCEPLN